MDEGDFTNALYEEFGIEPEAATPEPQAPTPEAGEEGKQPDTVETPKAEDDGQVPEDKTDEPAKPAEGAPETDGAEDKKPEAPEAPKYLTKDDVVEAMREYEQQTQGRVDQVHEARQQIIDTLHPEGIDTNIYDTNGNVVKTAQDIVDRGLINERTGEPFTYEEAASFMLQAQQQMAKNVEELNNWAEDIAEKNISLIESNKRVMEQYSDLLQAMPNVAKQLADTYIKTHLEFDKTGNYITKMTMSPEDFYALTLAPYRQLGEALAQKAALESSQQKQEQQNEQAERMGLPPQRGQSAMKSNTGDAMLDALMDELNKG